MSLNDFNVEWLEQEMGPCVLRRGETGIGPVGWHKGNPIGPVCDSCMIDQDRGLGAMLMTVNVVRELAAIHIDADSGPQDIDPSTEEHVVLAMLTYARRYHKAESAWPVRKFHFLEALAKMAPLMGGNGRTN